MYLYTYTHRCVCIGIVIFQISAFERWEDQKFKVVLNYLSSSLGYMRLCLKNIMWKIAIHLTYGYTEISKLFPNPQS